MKIKCTSCLRNVNSDTAWECESCGGDHHPKCSGEYGSGGGEYASETEYSVCKKCVKDHKKT